MTLPKVTRSGAHVASYARLELEPAAARDAEAGHDLVDDEQRAVRLRDAREPGVEARQRRDHAHVGGGGLGDDGGDVVAVRGERGLDRGEVVVGQHDRLVRLRAGDARSVRQREGREARAGGGEQRVDVAVVAAGELHDLRAAGEPAREPDRRHRRLGAAADQPHLLDGVDAAHDLLGEQHLAGARGAEGEAARGGVAHGLDDRGVRVAEHHRPPRADEVEVVAAVDVGDPRAACRWP